MSTKPTFRELKASFEQRSKATTATAYQSAAGNLANMSTSQRNSRVASLAKSIDSVLETLPAPSSPPVRPLAALRPSWIGPARTQRSVTPGMEAMKEAVTVEFSSPGLQPPLYIFTSLSDPQWEAVEMQCEMRSGEYQFSKVFHVEEGEYQYKFRLGDGDWWTCDHTKPTVDDGQGNSNNLLVVKSKDPMHAAQPNGKAPEDQQTASVPVLVMPKAPEAATAPAPLLKHEVHDIQKSSAAEQTPEREESNPFEVDDEEPDVSTVHAPLLRHESTKPSSTEQDHSPLFRHESISMGNNNNELPQKISESIVLDIPPVPEEADVSDESLERFPSDHAGILNEIRQASQRLEDQEAVSEDKEDIVEVEIEEEIIIEMVDEPKGKLERLTDSVGGPGNAMAIVLAILTVAAGLLAVRVR